MEPLAWDSEFFGVPIGRVDLEGADDTRLAAIERAAHETGVLCAYGSLEPEDSFAPVLAQRFGYRLVEVAITFVHRHDEFKPRPTESTVREGTLGDMPLLADAIDTLGPWSRFGVDPRFGPDAARRMFRAWVERAAHDDHRMLSISEDASGVTGVSAHVRGEPDRIDLMGVTKPGTGAAEAMIGFYLDWARPGPVEAGPCAARNVPVLRMLERCGFRTSRCQYQFHRWFDEESGVAP